MPHSLGGPAAAKITDKLTYKERFYFTSKPQRLTAEPPAGEQHRAAEASPAAPGTSAWRRNVSLKCQGEREKGWGGSRTLAIGKNLAMRKPAPCPQVLDHYHCQGPAEVTSGRAANVDHNVNGVPSTCAVYNLHNHTVQT